MRPLSRLENLFNTQKRFIADVGHELRTPLTVIRGNVDLMRRMQSTDAESMDSILGEVNRLSRMVDDLLLLAQAESGKLPLIKKTFEMDSLVLEVLSQMHILAKNRVSLKLGEIDQVLVCGDRDRLKQVLLNLVGNAINYTPIGGEVVVGLGKEGTRARLTVSDSGIGIPKEDLPYIFERSIEVRNRALVVRMAKAMGSDCPSLIGSCATMKVRSMYPHARVGERLFVFGCLWVGKIAAPKINQAGS